MTNAATITNEPGINPCDLIDSGTQLTVLPAAVPELLAALNDDELSFKELADTVAQFPTIAARLLFLANSSWAAPVAEITTIEGACAKLGLAVVKSVSVSIAIAAPFDPAKCPAFHSEQFWSSALLVADVASWLAECSEKIDDKDVATVHTAALLHNLGLLWMADSIPGETAQALLMAKNNSDLSLADALKHTCGADYAQVGGCLARAWNLPGVIESAMKNHLDFSYAGDHWQVAQLTGYAATMVHCLNHGIEALPEDMRLERLGVRSEQRDAIFERLQGRYENVREMVRVLFC